MLVLLINENHEFWDLSRIWMVVHVENIIRGGCCKLTNYTGGRGYIIVWMLCTLLEMSCRLTKRCRMCKNVLAILFPFNPFTLGQSELYPEFALK